MIDVSEKIKTVVLLMFENRSFDHMLGHLSLENINTAVDGLKQPMSAYDNLYNGSSYPLFRVEADSFLQSDVPHEWQYVDTQLAKSPVTQRYTMRGFIEAYADFIKDEPNPMADPIGYFPSHLVPISSFLAQNFCTCDRWFSALPTSTQPNRTMAFCGDTPIYDTKTRIITTPSSIFDWMNAHNIRWRNYHDGFSFFALYSNLWKYVLGNNFRDYENLYLDMKAPVGPNDPQVIIVEPTYEDAPHIGSDRPNDNHAPLAIGWGEEFLRRTYEAVIANPERWGNTAMIVYYDEHGGFYDHVSPPSIPYTTTGNPVHHFDNLGPRIPGIIISPFTGNGSICHNIFDHTSVLQFLADVFTPGKPYSASVNNRKNAGIHSLSEAFTTEHTAAPPLPPSQPISVVSALGKSIAATPVGGMKTSFEMAANQLLDTHPDKMAAKYPELFQWRDATKNARNQ